ncbi:Rv1733c family protein [Streptomyces sp. WZ-12]|uniref:Rv1733c family protein n=1 Tax=Streptomyces sp. WZ-12 TaxID=3030210 RepID=UPI00238151D1|nr:hypothetical protein [Streptomyces sp. WZ-12]
MKPGKALWRWRRNPLRRPSDVLEAAALLVASALVVVGGPAVGVGSGLAAQDAYRQQRRERYPATAFLVDDAPGRSPGAFSGNVGDNTVRAAIRWRDAQRSAHRGTTQVEAGRKAGSGITVWLDGSGRLAHEPLDPAGGAVAAALVGVLAAVAWCGAVAGAVWGLRAWLRRRRAVQWERAWAEGGPRWGDGRW